MATVKLTEITVISGSKVHVAKENGVVQIYAYDSGNPPNYRGALLFDSGDVTEIPGKGLYDFALAVSQYCVVVENGSNVDGLVGVWIVGTDNGVPDGSIGTDELADLSVTPAKTTFFEEP